MPSVMFDGSMLDYPTNLSETALVSAPNVTYGASRSRPSWAW